LKVFTAECIKLNVVMLNAVRLTVVAGISKIILSGCVITKVNRTFIVSLRSLGALP
jgi:hypothetical protein